MQQKIMTAAIIAARIDIVTSFFMTIFLLIEIVQNIKCKCCAKSENRGSEGRNGRGKPEEIERRSKQVILHRPPLYHQPSKTDPCWFWENTFKFLPCERYLQSCKIDNIVITL